MNKKISGLLLSMIVIGTFNNFSCAGRVPLGGFNPSPSTPPVNPTPTQQPEPTPPPVGSDVDIKFLQTFNPVFAIGMIYTQTVTVGTAKPEDVTKEITKVTADSLTVKIKNLQGTQEKTFTIADFTNPTSEPSDKVKFKYAGKEDIKVPAGDFKGAAKITLTNANGTFTGWLTPGTGTVKKTFTDAKKITTKTELKEFKDK